MHRRFQAGFLAPSAAACLLSASAYPAVDGETPNIVGSNNQLRMIGAGGCFEF